MAIVDMLIVSILTFSPCHDLKFGPSPQLI